MARNRRVIASNFMQSFDLQGLRGGFTFAAWGMLGISKDWPAICRHDVITKSRFDFRNNSERYGVKSIEPGNTGT